MGIDHGPLFQPEDRKRLKSDQINYDYYESSENSDLIKMEMGFAKPLRDVVLHLALMGVTIDQVRLEYEQAAADSDEAQKGLADLGGEKATSSMQFEQFLELAGLIDIGSLDGSYDESSIGKEPSEYGEKSY